jgi:hypothetical protein
MVLKPLYSKGAAAENPMFNRLMPQVIGVLPAQTPILIKNTQNILHQQLKPTLIHP